MVKPTVLFVNTALRQLFTETIMPTTKINDRLYISESEVEADEFQKFWNDKPVMQDGDGCRGILIATSVTLFIAAILLSIFLSSCATAHRPRYNHWAKPYKMYEPVKQHNPHKK